MWIKSRDNGLHILVYCIPSNPDRRYFFSAEILKVRHHNLQVIKTLLFLSKKHISYKVMNPEPQVLAALQSLR